MHWQECFQNMCDVRRASLSAQVMPSISKKKKKKGADATTNRTAVGQSLASNHACPLGDIRGFGFGLARKSSR
jgi:hypothetical protein